MDVRRFVAHERGRAHEAAARRRALLLDVRGRLPSLVTGLVARGATRVILFGSVARGDADEASDVDLGVAGLDARAVLEVAGWAEATMGRPVDLVRLEDAPAGLRSRIEDGEVLA